MGVPYHRDPEFPCDVYEPGKRPDGKSVSWECNGDGHFLCSEKCIHYEPEEENES